MELDGSPLWGTSTLFSLVALLFSILPAAHKHSHFSTSSVLTFCLFCKQYHGNRYEWYLIVAWGCNFLRLSIFCVVCVVFLKVSHVVQVTDPFWESIYTCVFPLWEVGWLLCCWVEGILYILWLSILHHIFFCSRLSFPRLDIVLWGTNFHNADEV